MEFQNENFIQFYYKKRQLFFWGDPKANDFAITVIIEELEPF